VFSGEQEKLKQLRSHLKTKKIKSLFLEVSTAFHCPILTKGKAEFKEFLS
jgi:malonyl CoA-acyl carrier protein transacylase